jgi:hypothetical protein
MRSIWRIISVIVLISVIGISSGQERMRFADDHYEVIGSPNLVTAVVTPIFQLGEDAALKIVIANSGRVESLTSKNPESGHEKEAAKELLDEFRCVDAVNLEVELSAEKPLTVITGPQNIEVLPSGTVVPLKFDFLVDDIASGTYELMLSLKYDYQIDANVGDDRVDQLIIPSTQSENIFIMIEGNPVSFRVANIISDLSPGKSGTVTFVIMNTGRSIADNCSIRLIAASPFQTSNVPIILGDIGPAEVEAISFDVFVDKDASPQEYQLALELAYQNGRSSLVIPVVVENNSNILYWIIPVIVVFIGVALLFARKRTRGFKSTRRGNRRNKWSFG